MATHINGESEFRTLPLSERKVLTIRPTFNQARISAVSKPTAIYYGAFQAYSMPIWNETTNVEELLYYRFTVPKRWDGETNPVCKIYTFLTGTEDVGDVFTLDLGYNCATCDGTTITNTLTEAYAVGNIVAGSTAPYSTYCVECELNATKIAVDGLFAGYIARTSIGTPEVDNEIAVMYMSVEFPIDKLYDTWI